MDDVTIKAFRCALERSGMDHDSIEDLLRDLKLTTLDDQGTEELADSLGLQPQSIHARISRFGHYYGLRPEKLPNGRWRWPRNAKALLKRQGRGR